MINVDELGARLIFGFTIGDVTIRISETTIFGWIVAAALAVLGIWLGSGLKTVPKGKQIVAEAIVGWIYNFTKKNLGKENERYGPYIGTLFAFVLFTSAFGLFGLRPVTADINMTGALALSSFLVIQVEGVRVNGLKGRMREFVTPYPFMAPIKIIENLTLPLTLALRLFGNIFGGMIVVELWMYLMEYLSSLFSPVPILRAVLVLPLNFFFDMFEPAIQTYIFTMLTVVNLRTAITAAPPKKKKKKARRNDRIESKTAAETAEAVPEGDPALTE